MHVYSVKIVDTATGTVADESEFDDLNAAIAWGRKHICLSLSVVFRTWERK